MRQRFRRGELAKKGGVVHVVDSDEDLGIYACTRCLCVTEDITDGFVTSGREDFSRRHWATRTRAPVSCFWCLLAGGDAMIEDK